MGISIQDIASQIPTLQEEFTDFLETEDFWSKANTSLQLLLPREKALLTRIFEMTEDELPEFFAEKLKERSVSVGKKVCIWEFTYQDLFFSKYTTNYDLEFDAFNKGDDTIQFKKKQLVKFQGTKRFGRIFPPDSKIGSIKFHIAQYPFPWMQKIQEELAHVLPQEITKHWYTEKFRKVPRLLSSSQLSWEKALLAAVTSTVGYHLLGENPCFYIRENSPFYIRRRFLEHKIHEDLNNVLSWFITLDLQNEKKFDDEKELVWEKDILRYKLDRPGLLNTNEDIIL